MFVCNVSNYSDYTEVVVVENDHIVLNKSTKQLSFGCQANVPDTSLATCTVNISISHHPGSLKYKLCVGYNSLVLHNKTPLQCSDDVTVNTTRSSCKILGTISRFKYFTTFCFSPHRLKNGWRDRRYSPCSDCDSSITIIICSSSLHKEKT